MKRALLVVVLAACNTPVPSLQLALAGPPSQACPSTACMEVPMNCQAVMSIRIIDPMDPASPYLSQCVQVSTNRSRSMCAIANVDLESTPIPVRDLEVQVALYPATEISVEPTNPNKLQCPTMVMYSAATGFPVEQSPSPALGGHAFYHPGDETVVVTLGCTDLAALNESCVVSNQVAITATIDDFETRFPVMGGASSLADQLWVSVGEPQVADSRFVLGPGDLRLLNRTSEGPIAAWGGDIDYQFHKYVCLDVLEAAAQSTATLRCKAVTGGANLDLRGVWMAKEQVDEILNALSLVDFPDEGLTVGMVVDAMGNPVEGAVVSANQATVSYLSKQRDSFDTGQTSATGIFLSRDAVFGTEFSTGGGSQPTIYGVGGRVANKVTVVILQPGGPAS
ncbi:MAG TPA: hypothetical protein VHN14_23925 [Kofleriaceae bacterium]|jgi:hypothetical protein|nr:hypothetical protein [Kofleriaceae bacterium]